MKKMFDRIIDIFKKREVVRLVHVTPDGVVSSEGATYESVGRLKAGFKTSRWGRYAKRYIAQGHRYYVVRGTMVFEPSDILELTIDGEVK